MRKYNNTIYNITIMFLFIILVIYLNHQFDSC
jgi:hypothetical protein